MLWKLYLYPGRIKMEIKEINISGFGKFYNYHVLFSDGIQVIYGKNEAGKTTLRKFIIAMLFGLEKGRGLAARNDDYSKYRPLKGGLYGGSMVISHDGQRYRIWRNMETGQQELRLFYEDTMEEIPLQGKELKDVLFESSKEAFLNTVSMTQSDIRTGKEMQQILQNSMANLSRSQNVKLDIGKAVNYLKEKRREIKKNVVFAQVIEYRQRLKEHPFQESRLQEYEKEEEKLQRKLYQKRKISILGKFLLFIKRLFGIDEEALRKKEIFHDLEILQLKKKHLLEEKKRKEQLEQQYNQSLQQRNRLEQEIHRIETAIHAIQEAAGNVQRTFGDDLNEKISETFSQMTGNYYEKVVMDTSMNIMVKRDFDYIDMKYLSNGTVEQLYFALRIAAADLLYEKDGFPLLLDDVFGNYDEERIERTLAFLDRQQKRQVIFFTCRQEMLKLLENTEIDYHLICL